MDLSGKIALARKKRGLTQEELASLANVTVRTIQRIESGESVPRAFTIKALANALEVNFEDWLGEATNGDFSNSTVLEENTDPGKDRHLLQMLCLSCFSYLLIPFVHFLIPAYLLKKIHSSHPITLVLGRMIIKQQIYWIIALHLLMLLTLAYNLISAAYFHKAGLISYLLPFFGMYLVNAFIILAAFRRINKTDLSLRAAF